MVKDNARFSYLGTDFSIQHSKDPKKEDNMHTNNKHNIYGLRMLSMMIALLFLALFSLAQTRLTDGEIIYSVQADPSGGTPTAAANALKGGQLVFNFKNYLFRSELKIGKMDYINIRNSKEHSAISLIDGGPGNKYLIRMSPSQVKKEAARYEGMTFDLQPDTKEIAGYTCHKATGKLTNGNTFVVYYTKELQPVYTDYSPRFEKLEGFPLQFEVNTRHGVKLIMTATSVNTDLQPSALFNTPTSGYRVLTYEQLQQLRKGQ